MDRETVKEYYGKTLGGTEDLKTSACCSTVRPPDPVIEALKNVHPEVSGRFYGCGVVVPEADMTGWYVVDLGSGSGQDVYVLAQLVGEEGYVTGVDMTPEQLKVARHYESWHRERFGYRSSNVRFLEGYVDQLGDLPIEPASIDLIVSNCVINLVSDKAGIFAGAASILKPGGRFLFSDVFVDKPVPADIARDPAVRGECLGGAMTLEQFEALRTGAGFAAPVWKEERPLTVDDPGIARMLTGFTFESRTVELVRA